MLVQEFVSKEISTLQDTDSIERAISWCESHVLSEAVCVSDEGKVAVIPLELLGEKDLKSTLQREFGYIMSAEYLLHEHSNVFEALSKFSEIGSTSLVVVNEDSSFKGVITLEDTLEHFSHWSFIKEKGGVIVFSCSVKKYSSSEIARIVESENLKLMALFILNQDLETIEVAIKVNSYELSSLANSLERFSYSVIHRFFQYKQDDIIEDRYHNLMKYLET